jgi:Arc/MetJ family transcription regulator
MRTNVAIDNSLMQQAMQTTGFSTEEAVVEEGIRLRIRIERAGRSTPSSWKDRGR